jgi:hypothetical protein
LLAHHRFLEQWCLMLCFCALVMLLASAFGFGCGAGLLLSCVASAVVLGYRSVAACGGAPVAAH